MPSDLKAGMIPLNKRHVLYLEIDHIITESKVKILQNIIQLNITEIKIYISYMMWRRKMHIKGLIPPKGCACRAYIWEEGNKG